MTYYVSVSREYALNISDIHATAVMATIAELQLPGGHPYYLALAALGIAAIGFVFHALRSPLANVPGPWHTKFTGAVLTIQTAKGNGAVYIHDLHEKYGSYHD